MSTCSTLAELAKEQKKSATLRKANADDASDAESIEIEKEASAESFLEFLKKARTGERIPPNVIIKFAGYFSDNLTLDNMERMQLIPMCKYMGILPYGNDNLLRFQLRHKIRVLKDDDQRILWEGIDSLTKMELREACRERGMRSTGLSKEAYKKSLEEWLELSVRQNVPIVLLIMSRTFYLHDEMVSGESQPDDGSKRVAGLADAMSGIDKDVLNEIVLEMATSKEKSSNADVMKIQLEVLEHHNELIKEEQEERDAAAKEKAEEERKRIEQKEQEEKEAAAAAANATAEERQEVKPDTLSEKTLDGADSTVVFKDTSVISAKVTKDKVPKEVQEEEDEDEQFELSPEEIEAISGLVSPDPLHREREDLKRIKDKIQAESSSDKDVSDSTTEEPQTEKTEESLEMMSAISPNEPMYTDEAQNDARQSIKELDEINEIRKEAKSVVSLKGDTGAKIVVENPDDGKAVAGDQKLQKAIDRLKSRVESMVGKIETHLSDVEVKIGNKFHLLDKDMVSIAL
jgi:aryl carrier-like protein